MSEKQLSDEINYRLSISIANEMLLKSLITDKEFHLIKEKLLVIYSPVIGCL